MKAFVTGSTGLLGSNLVKLLLAQGFEVKVLARSRQKAEQLLSSTPGVQIVVGDMEDIDGFKEELVGSDVLFHVAAYFREYYSLGEHWQKLKKINVDGTIHLFNEAEKHGVQKAIYVSSSTVIGRRADNAPADESMPPDKFSEENLYARSKVLAEAAIADWLKTHRMPVILILPTVMVGPQDAAPTTMGQAIVNLLNRELPVIPPGGNEFVDARDVAQAMINAVERGKNGERYIVSQGYYTVRQMAHALEEVSGVPAPRLNVPYPVMAGLIWLGERAATLQGKQPQLTISALRTLHRERKVSAEKAIQELKVNFRSFEDSLRDEAQWFKANGYVQGRAIASK